LTANFHGFRLTVALIASEFAQIITEVASRSQAFALQFPEFARIKTTQIARAVLVLSGSMTRLNSQNRNSGSFCLDAGQCREFVATRLRRFIDWWIDPDTGLAIQERSGVLRWFVRVLDELHWADSAAELREPFGADSEPKSVTFIPARLSDNRILLEKDPAYFRNERRAKDTHPEYTGQCVIDGRSYWISAWIKEGQTGKFFSLAFKPKEPTPKPATKAQPAAYDSEDDIAF